MSRGALVVPVRMGVTPYGFIERYQALKAGESSPDGIAHEILGVLLAHDSTALRMTEVLVALFEASGSFRDAIDRSYYLEEIKVWSRPLLKRIERASSENVQINHAYGVPGRVAAIIRKYKESFC